MSENIIDVADTDTDKGAGSGDGYNAPATQADLDRIISERLGRERAKYADYDELKSKAGKLTELEEAQKTEFEKINERAAAAEAREAAAEAKAAAAELKALKSDVARDKGVPVGSLVGTTQEELEASADELVKWRDANVPAVKKSLRSGYVRDTSSSNPRERAVAALRSGL